MSFKNIFESGAGESKDAADSVQAIHAHIPGARPERDGVDPELYEGLPEVVRDPKLVREASPEALSIANTFLTPFFAHAQTAATRQQSASENPESTSAMASATKDETFKKVKVDIKGEDRPHIDDDQRQKSAKANYEAAKHAHSATDGASDK